MSKLSVTEAIKARKSVRKFQQEPVSREVVLEVLSLAGLSASGSNLQPWKIYALTAEIKDKLIKRVTDLAMKNPQGERADIRIYPETLESPWKDRRSLCGEVMYETLGISREDKLGRMRQALKNFTFFGAPVGLILTMDRSLSESQIIDLGLVLQNIQLLAVERGLGTCVQASWTMWPETIREVLEISDNEMVMAGVSMGYPNDSSDVNHISQPRIDPAEFISLRGF